MFFYCTYIRFDKKIVLFFSIIGKSRKHQEYFFSREERNGFAMTFARAITYTVSIRNHIALGFVAIIMLKFFFYTNSPHTCRQTIIWYNRIHFIDEASKMCLTHRSFAKMIRWSWYIIKGGKSVWNVSYV